MLNPRTEGIIFFLKTDFSWCTPENQNGLETGREHQRASTIFLLGCFFEKNGLETGRKRQFHNLLFRECFKKKKKSGQNSLELAVSTIVPRYDPAANERWEDDSKARHQSQAMGHMIQSLLPFVPCDYQE